MIFKASLSLQTLLQLKPIKNLNNTKYQLRITNHQTMESMKPQNIMITQVIPTRNKLTQSAITHHLQLINHHFKSSHIHQI